MAGRTPRSNSWLSIGRSARNREAIGAIAELLGAVGVIASLVYLATQIRQSREQMAQNTQALRASAYQESMNQRDNMMLPIALDGEISEVMWSGFEGVRDLSEEDSRRFNIFMITLMGSIENTHYQKRMGFLDEDRWRVHLHRLRVLLQSPGVAAWWETNPLMGGISPEFEALVQQILAEEPDRGE